MKSIGQSCDINLKTTFINPENIEIGSYVYIGPNANINGLGKVSINSGTIIGPNINIHSANHNFRKAKFIPYDETFDYRPVKIGENVWIGGNVIIVPGTEIGEGCIIGAGTVVSGKIPALSIVVGNPAKIIDKRDDKHYFDLKEKDKIYLKAKFSKEFKSQ